ncbi:MAG: SIMPL domain-containing protein [Mycobacterium sp.]
MPIAERPQLSTRFLLLAAAALAAFALAACDSKVGPAGQSSDNGARQVTVVGAGQVEGKPDTLTVAASIEFVAPDVSGAMNQTSDRQQAVIDALAGSGIDRKDIATTQVSMQPQFAGGDNTAIVGYRASNSIAVKIRKLDSASQALTLITSAGGDATRISSVKYSIEDDSQLVKDARARAFGDARDRAQQYAQLSGLKLGKVVSITESGSAAPPTPMPTTKSPEVAAVPLEPGQQTVGFSVTVIFELS